MDMNKTIIIELLLRGFTIEYDGIYIGEIKDSLGMQKWQVDCDKHDLRFHDWFDLIDIAVDKFLGLKRVMDKKNGYRESS